MSLIKKHIAKLDKLEKNLPKIASRAVKAKKDFILSTLKHDQLGEGEDSSGRIVGDYAASTQSWANINPKARTAKPWNEPYNFEWTGKFFDTMRIKTDDDGFDIDSARKAELESIYRTELTKLSPDNMEFVTEKIIKPALYEYVLDNLGSF